MAAYPDTPDSDRFIDPFLDAEKQRLRYTF